MTLDFSFDGDALSNLGIGELSVGDELTLTGTVRVTAVRVDQREGRPSEAPIVRRRVSFLLSNLALAAQSEPQE